MKILPDLVLQRSSSASLPASLFVLYVLLASSSAQELNTANHHAYLTLNATFPEDPTHQNLQQVILKCVVMYAQQVSMSSSSSSTVHHPVIGTGRGEEKDGKHPKYDDDNLRILLNGSYMYSSSTVIGDYTTSALENNGLKASFYLSQTEQFFGEFMCEYANTTKNSTSNVTSANLSLVYVPGRLGRSTAVTVYACLTACFGFLFLLALVFLCGSIVVNIRHSFFKKSSYTEKKYLQSRDDIESGIWNLGESKITYNSAASPPLFMSVGDTLSSSTSRNLLAIESCPNGQRETSNGFTTNKKCGVTSDEESTNALLKYLAHPSPCQDVGCPCSRYKVMLEDYKGCYNNLSSAGETERESACGSSVEVDCVRVTQDKQFGALLLSTFIQKPLRDISTEMMKENESVVYPKITDSPCYHDFPSDDDNKMYYIEPPETVTMDVNGGKYANEDHEVYLQVPEGAIPRGKTVTIKVGVSLTSSLVSLLPPATRPVSPLVTFHVEGEDNFEFLKPVKVILPHFVDISDENDAKAMGLTFMKARCHLYCFHRSDGVATFWPKSHKASLKTKHFCSFCIMANERVRADNINYGLVKVVPRSPQLVQWRASFCVTYYLRTCLQVSKW